MVLRVNALDDHIMKILIGQTLKVLKFFPTWILNNCEYELYGILQFILTYINDSQYVVSVLKAASFINFLLFLHQKKYSTLAQRFLNLSQELTHRRNVEYFYMTRELLWLGFSIRDDKQWSDKILIISAICHDKSVLPHIVKCSRVFCFYCLSAKNKDKQGYNYDLEIGDVHVMNNIS